MDHTFQLPEIAKKVIYLDQFVVSEMMKSINPASQSYANDKLIPFRRIYEKIDRLSKLQLIVCPHSMNHQDESMMMGESFSWMKRVYEQLSHGIYFNFPQQIRERQIYGNAKAWLGRGTEEILPNDVISGNIHSWQGRLLMTANRKFSIAEANEIALKRDNVADKLSDNFRVWQSENHMSLDDFYKRELSGFGQSIVERYKQYVTRLHEVYGQTGDGHAEMLSNLASFSDQQFRMVRTQFIDCGVHEAEVNDYVVNYFLSASVKEIPYVQIAAMLFASLAREAANGRTKLPTRGMINDIQVIASYAPYCDAILIDRECHALLAKVPRNSVANSAKTHMQLDEKVYSAKNLDDFFVFLDRIEAEASHDHMDLVREIYGSDWEKPYTSIFSN